MAKSNLKLSDHLIYSEEKTVEVWHEGELVASVYGADGPGIRVITKYPYDVIRGGRGEIPNIVEIRIEVK